MKSADIRKAFLDFFRNREHEIVPGSSLVPANDPTLLFTNAGMVQFKEVFLGLEQRPYRRAASVQRCVRAGGKHNDLDNVGYTARHHTFFEMLGNFSFGDYFKREAITCAWEFLTGELGLAPERLWITVFEEDDEAAGIWLDEIGVDPQRFARIGAHDNFWSMGDTGPCGPCSEIFYDHGPDVAGGPPGTPDEDGDRYVEIWNLVFMQYDRDTSGKLCPLPKPSVDTGMGLERLAAVMQGVHDNYDIDLFQSLIRAVASLTANPAGCDNTSLKVIADHIRSCAFMVADGVMPANEGRGYVLRRIIRRAIRHGNRLGLTDPFFHKLVDPLIGQMGAAYPELPAARDHVVRVLKQEEERFAETLEHGLRHLEQALEQLEGTVIPGETVFRLYDTYGFPVDLTADIARERGYTLDMAGFEREMAAQRQRARAASHFAGLEASVDVQAKLKAGLKVAFSGYDHLEEQACVEALYADGQPVEQLQEGQQGMVVTNITPFYAESGGQVGDCGELRAADALFKVSDTRKEGEVTVHLGVVSEGRLAVGDRIVAQVDAARRQDIACHHSATHLLHAALRKVLGEHVVQKGSLVAPERLRFDFSHFEPLDAGQLAAIEQLVNAEIRANLPIETRIMSPQEATEAGAMALFGEKYGEQVRVLSMGAFSIELCGGTHVRRTGDIGLFKIIAESGVAAGVRRIEAVAGQRALEWYEAGEKQLHRVCELLKAERDTVVDKLSQQLERSRSIEKALEELKRKLATSQGGELVARAVDVNGIKVLAARLDGADAKTLRSTVDQLKDKLGSAAIVLASVDGGKITLIAGVTRDITDRIQAGDLINSVASQVGGKGGGRPDLAQAGGNRPDALAAALDSVADWVRRQ